MDPELKRLLDTIFAYRKSKAVFATIELQVFDIIHSFGPLSLDQIVEKSEPKIAAPEGLDLLLKTSVCLGLLSHDNGTYSLTPMSSKYFVSSSPDSLASVYKIANNVDYKLFGALETSLKNADNVESQQFNQGIDYEVGNRESILTSLKASFGASRYFASDTVSAFDLSQYKKIVDLGGAAGALMIAACEANPSASAVIVDLPAVVELAQDTFSIEPYITTENVRARVSWQAADFVAEADKVPDADLFTLSQVLPFWEDASVKQILSSVYEKLKAGGALLICEHMLNEDKCGPEYSVMTDVTLLLKKAGKLRTASEYKSFLESAGFSSSEVKSFKYGWTAVLATKA